MPSTVYNRDGKEDFQILDMILVSNNCWFLYGPKERITTIKALRERAELPTDMKSTCDPALCQLIVKLVQRDPASRPKAAEVLSSKLLPPRIDVDLTYLKEIRDALTRPNSDAAAAIINTLFRRKGSDQGDQEHEAEAISPLEAFQANLNYSRSIVASMASQLHLRRISSSADRSAVKKGKVDTGILSLPVKISAMICQHVANKFRQLGGVDLSPLLLQLRSDAHNDLQLDFLDSSGNVVALCENAIASSAHVVAALGLKHAHHFHIGDVFPPSEQFQPTRTSAKEGSSLANLTTSQASHPQMVREGIFCIVSTRGPTKAASVSPEVSAMCAALAAISEFKRHLPPLGLRFTVGRVLQCIVDIAVFTVEYRQRQTSGDSPPPIVIDESQYVAIMDYLSHCSDSVDAVNQTDGMRQKDIPSDVIAGLVPYGKILSNRLTNTTTTSSVLEIIDQIYAELYKNEAILHILRVFAEEDPSTPGGTAAGGSSKLSTTKATSGNRPRAASGSDSLAVKISNTNISHSSPRTPNALQPRVLKKDVKRYGGK